MARVGHKVMQLHRIEFGPLKLGRIVSGKFRPLKPPEIKALRQFAEELERQPLDSDGKRPRSSGSRKKTADKRTTTKKSTSKAAAAKKKATSRKPAAAGKRGATASGKPKRKVSKVGKGTKKKQGRKR